MQNILTCWIGGMDLKAMDPTSDVLEGPIVSALKKFHYEYVILLCNYDEKDGKAYKKWALTQLEKESQNITVDLIQKNLSSPTNMEEIYVATTEILSQYQEKIKDCRFTFHLSPGTPAMATIWILLSATQYQDCSSLIESSPSYGVKEVVLPFQADPDLIDFFHQRETKVLERIHGNLYGSKSFEEIVAESSAMELVIKKAETIAPKTSIPVLIEGETGTGKELLARAIHKASRVTGRFVPVNCGAIPADLFESLFWGHEKGSFTGASEQHDGYLCQAFQGTLFLDEFGELPLISQVKLLRVLETKEYQPIGSEKPNHSHFRLIVATNKNLIEEINNKRFRSDLYYRVSVARIKIPPLRERKEDLAVFIEMFRKEANDINKEYLSVPRGFTKGAKDLLKRYPWPGNVRELRNVIFQSVLWGIGRLVSEDEVMTLFSSDLPHKPDELLSKHIDKNFDIQGVIGDVVQHFFQKAWKEAEGVKSHASQLLGFKNYQTFDNWVEKYQVDLED